MIGLGKVVTGLGSVTTLEWTLGIAVWADGRDTATRFTTQVDKAFKPLENHM
jgi:hypothetical protein